ncbi:neuronal acetylcholine receptor subunit alpha-10-like [Tubulanus polymorphus]|uniref:neuronal acetylcholine receptor subunit alpha-10-like n=1 Tax=Tubulanus polymorphus TaxID=672921 RepID=UPI003DA4F459
MWIILSCIFFIIVAEKVNSVLAGSRRLNRGGRRGRGESIDREYRSNEYKIKQKLMKGYDKTSRPVKNDNSTIKLNIAMSLFHILDTNEKHQTFSSLVSVRLRWVDEYLHWNPAQFGNVTSIHIPAYDIWIPDLVISNHADDTFSGFLNTYAVIQSSGDVLWMFPAVVKIYCSLDVRHFPFDQQHCDIVFISWTYNGFQLDIYYNKSYKNTVYYTSENQEWYVNKITEDRHEKKYACCDEPYPDVTFTIHMSRRSLFYVFNLIFPCMLIYVVSMLGFFLPIESGEKVNLEITILLALVVFLMIIGETLPPTPDAIPLLGMLFGTTMLMVSVALIMGVIVTNIHLRRYSDQEVPAFVRRIFLRCKCHRKSKVKVRTSMPNRDTIELDALASNGTETEALAPNTPRSRMNGTLKRDVTGHRLAYASREGSITDIDQEVVLPLRSSIATHCKCHGPEGWTACAKFLDRLFFWMFFTASVLAFFFIFYQVPIHVFRDPKPPS